jgi:hypothetical protein
MQLSWEQCQPEAHCEVTTARLHYLKRSFRALQNELQRAENVDEADPQLPQTYGGNVPWLKDHGMDIYLERIDDKRGLKGTPFGSSCWVTVE